MEFVQETVTLKGQRYIKFEDVYKQVCSIQESSLSTAKAIWLGVEISVPESLGGTGDAVMARMHLTQDQVARLLPYLLQFVETGKLDAESH